MIFFFFFYNSSIRQKDKEGNKKGILYTETQDLKSVFSFVNLKYCITQTNWFPCLLMIFIFLIFMCYCFTFWTWTLSIVLCGHVFTSVRMSFLKVHSTNFIVALFVRHCFTFYPQPFFKTTTATANLKYIC